VSNANCLMQSIIEIYKDIDIYPYELYTLMLTIASNKSIDYNLEKHIKLLAMVA